MAASVNSNINQLLSPEYTHIAADLIKRTDVDLSSIGIGTNNSGYKPVAYLLSSVLSQSECEALIRQTEALGYSPALVHHGDQAVLAKGYRDSQRLMIDNKDFVSILYERIGHLLPQTLPDSISPSAYELKEINERLRFLRYDPGDQFKAHRDGHYSRPDGSATSRITLQIYLNEGFHGGETTFLRSYESSDQDINRVPVVPQTGMVLVFQHNLIHEGSLLKAGRKYTIRTDVLYQLKEEDGEDDSFSQEQSNKSEAEKSLDDQAGESSQKGSCSCI
jgi:hypothetical protein